MEVRINMVIHIRRCAFTMQYLEQTCDVVWALPKKQVVKQAACDHVREDGHVGLHDLLELSEHAF